MSPLTKRNTSVTGLAFIILAILALIAAIIFVVLHHKKQNQQDQRKQNRQVEAMERGVEPGVEQGDGQRAAQRVEQRFEERREQRPVQRGEQTALPTSPASRRRPPSAINTVLTKPHPARKESMPQSRIKLNEENDHGDRFKVTPLLRFEQRAVLGSEQVVRHGSPGWI